jgi:hypothetical protein
MVHITNLAIQTVSHLDMVSIIDYLLQTLYNYFSKNLKRHLEFTKLVKFMETKGVKILKNVQTCWIFMLFLVDML